MANILVVCDADWVRNEVHAALSVGANTLIDHSDPATAAATAVELGVDVLVVDLQIGAMGGMAVTRDVRAKAERLPVVLLLDRKADAFLARRAGARAWVVKPFTARALRDAVGAAAGTLV